MSLNFLDFEQPIADLEAKIEALQSVTGDNEINIGNEIQRLKQKSTELTKSIFSSLTPWQVVQLARHPQRPLTLDYIERIITDFDELHGDRHFADDGAIVGGIGKLGDTSVMVMGHQKGRSTKEKLKRNFGMPRPESYRKALRFMQLAEKFKLPILTFIDTAGAWPGIDGEERNQSEAIARNLYEMVKLKTPIICTVIGEGGSGGALAIGVGDRILMLQYSVYSVITPEGCASILWKTIEKASVAAEAMQMTAPQLLKLGLIDQVVEEPLGGAHRDVDKIALKLKESLIQHLQSLQKISTEKLLEQRFQHWLSVK